MSRVLPVLAVLVLLASCATTPGPAPTAVSAPAPAGAPAAPAAGAAEVARMKEFLAAGLDRIDQGLVADGIKQLVSVLAERQQLCLAAARG